MATITVTNTNDSGAGSLRQAVLDANATFEADTIKFAIADDAVIVLTTGELAVTGPLIIDGDMDGDHKADVTLSGNDASRIISAGAEIGGFANLGLYSLTLENGHGTDGGAVYMGSGALKLTDTTVRDSYASANGGGVMVKAGQLFMTTSLLTGNTAHGGGGGLYAGNATLTNSTVHANSADGDGGGIKVAGGLTLLNSTVTGNMADADGGANAPPVPHGGGIAVSAFGGLTPTVTITNSVVAENSSSALLSGATDNVLGTVTTAKNSAFGGFVTITTDTNSQMGVTDAGLGALQDNGGATQTRDIASIYSVLFNRGDNYAAHLLATDANGDSRVEHLLVDIGATEFQGALPFKVTTASDVVDAHDGLTSLREALSFVGLADTPATITFDASLAGQTITLSSELALTQDVAINGDINGDDKADITISGGDTTRIFNITGAETDIDLVSLTLEHGRTVSSTSAPGGAAVNFSGHSLDVMNTTMRDNHADGRGGAIFSLAPYRADSFLLAGGAPVSLVNCLLTGNIAGGSGGAIYTVDSALLMKNSTVDGNQAARYGGIGFGSGFGALDVRNSTITRNQSGGLGSGTTGWQIKIHNTVIAENIGSNGASLDITSRTLFWASNCIFGTAPAPMSGSSNNVIGVMDVGLGELLDNGGAVLTRSPLDGSFLIDKGLAGILPADTFDLDHDGNTTEALPLDGRGRLRLVGGSLDVGAVEQTVNEHIRGTADANHIYGGLGKDLIEGLGGADTLDGGGGKDTLTYASSKTGVTVDLLAGTGLGGDAQGDIISGFESLTGSSKSDTLIGDAAANRISGAAGNDRIDGGGGVDHLFGAAGADTFVLANLKTSHDVIKSFVAGEDHLEVSAALFGGGLTAGVALTDAQLWLSTDGLAHDRSDRFILDTLTGDLFFDANGSNKGSHVLIAHFDGGIPALSTADVLIV